MNDDDEDGVIQPMNKAMYDKYAKLLSQHMKVNVYETPEPSERSEVAWDLEDDDYWPGTREEEKLKDIATELMDALEAQGLEDFVLLRSDKVRAWWGKEKKKRDAKRRAEEERRRKAEIKEAAKKKYDDFLATLSSEERKALGK